MSKLSLGVQRAVQHGEVIEPGSLKALAAEANREHGLAMRSGIDMVDHAGLAGHALIAAKGKVKHGEWLPWLAANFEGSEDTAERYMKVARYSARVRNIDEPSLRKALHAIGSDSASRRAKEREADADARLIEPGGDDQGGDGWTILTGDFRERLAGLDGTIALIITDPPYPEEFADLWTDLAVHAKRILRPGGIAAIMSGKIHLDDRMHRLGEHLAYGWVYCQLLPGENTRVLARHVIQEWKPWLCYSNGPWPSGRVEWNGDLLTAGPKAKDRYHWQQQLDPAVELIERLTASGDLVVDPFCGSGTFGIAALRAGRRFIGVEADAKRVAVAAAALRDAAA